MGFSAFKEKKTKQELEVELRVLENSLNDDLPKGDKVIIEKKIEKIKQKLEAFESTVAGDIAVATNNLMSDCTGKPDCDCQKCRLLKRDPVAEAVQEEPIFGKLFGM